MSDTPVTTQTWTVFSCTKAEPGMVSIDTIYASSLREAISAARTAHATSFDVDPDDVHVYGAAEGTIKLAYWEDLPAP